MLLSVLFACGPSNGTSTTMFTLTNTYLASGLCLLKWSSRDVVVCGGGAGGGCGPFLRRFVGAALSRALRWTNLRTDVEVKF